MIDGEYRLNLTERSLELLGHTNYRQKPSRTVKSRQKPSKGRQEPSKSRP
jgi:hypothetical protein